MAAPPPIKKGWMRKQGRSGLMKNWKTRFFVLADGKISYYVSEISEAPFGDGLKGELNLVNSEVVDEHTKTVNDKQIFVVSFNGENNILMETDDAKETADWSNAIKNHINYYNKVSSARVQSMSISRSGSNASAPGTTPQGEGKVAASPGKDDDNNKNSPVKSEVDGSASPVPGVESKRSSIARRKVSVAVEGDDNNQTSSASASSGTGTGTAGASPVMEYKVYTLDVIANIILDCVMSFLMNSDERNKTLSSILPTIQATIMNGMENFMEGESGKRGEKVVIAAMILFFLVIVGVGNRYLFLLIQTVMSLSGSLLLVSGVTMLLNSMWELKDHFSPLLIPSPGNKVVTTGVYQLVRHPMYCGVIMIAFGWSIVQQQVYKMVLSMALFIVLNYAAEKEEEFLEKKHPKAYPLYANTKRAIIPFLY